MSLEKVGELISRAITLTNRINPGNQRKQVNLAWQLVMDASALKVRGTGALLKRLVNELNSAREALDLTTKYIRLDFSELKKAPAELLNLQNKEQQKEESDELDNDEMANVFRRFQSESKRVALLGRPFGIFRVPIVAIAKPMLSADALNSAGVKAEDVSDYTIIHNQLVIGIDPKKSGKNKPVQEAKRIAELIGKSKHVKILFVTESGVLQRGMWWYWVGEPSVLNQLVRASRNRLNIQDWGFAFD